MTDKDRLEALEMLESLLGGKNENQTKQNKLNDDFIIHLQDIMYWGLSLVTLSNLEFVNEVKKLETKLRKVHDTSNFYKGFGRDFFDIAEGIVELINCKFQTRLNKKYTKNISLFYALVHMTKTESDITSEFRKVATLEIFEKDKVLLTTREEIIEHLNKQLLGENL